MDADPIFAGRFDRKPMKATATAEI